NVMEYWTRAAASVRLDVGRPDHLAPFLGVVGDELAKVGGRADSWCATQIGEPRLDLMIGESGIHFVVELLDDLGRPGPRCAQAGPTARRVARHKFPDVGTSGSASERVAVATARARSLPALMYSIDEGMVANMTCTCPLRRSVRAGPPPRYGLSAAEKRQPQQWLEKAACRLCPGGGRGRGRGPPKGGAGAA